MGRKRISNNHWTAGALIVILALLIFFAPSYGWTVREWLSPSPSGQNDPSATQADDATLAAQNDALRAQLASLQILSAQLPTSSPNEIRAMVYSRYPLNFKNELLVNAGSNDGVAAGAAVIFQGMLIGQVRTVFPNESLVQTIFDNNLKMPVRVGASGTNGLLQGVPIRRWDQSQITHRLHRMTSYTPLPRAFRTHCPSP